MSTHSIISYIKSIIRIVGFTFLVSQEFFSAAITLIIAEVVGIVEELFEK
jgi:hypothetical protein